MLCSVNSQLETRNFIDKVDFTKNDPCLFVTYPAGAAGDLLISIIDKHYLRTGCEYYGIENTGRIKLYTTDYEMIDLSLTKNKYPFNDQWFWNLAEQLGNRRLNYSLLDQVIFGCHLWENFQLENILDTFPNAKIINIRPKDSYGSKLIEFLRRFKLDNLDDKDLALLSDNLEIIPFKHERVYTLPFGTLFNEKSYDIYYKQIIDFLSLEGRLISFDYIKYYLSKQHPKIKNLLIDYSQQYV